MRDVFLLALIVPSVFAAEYRPPEPVRPIKTLLLDWRDSTRDRVVPAKIYYPADAKGPSPVIIFSHGLGGSREGYAYLGEHWAGAGFVSVHLQHAGSDEGVWKEVGILQRMAAMKRAAADPRNAVNRTKDVSFAIDELARMNERDGVLPGRMDLKRIGVAGHSFGGHTALSIAGMNYSRGKLGDGRDERVNVAIQMSAPAASKRVRTYAYDSVAIPVFHMTGTKDESPINSTTAEDRRIPYDHSKGEACFLNFDGGDHAVFSGRKRLSREAARQDELFQRHVCRGSTAFWEAWLSGNESAKRWLLEGSFRTELGQAGFFETRRIP